MHKLEKLFNPQSIAIVGASAEEGKVGQVITKNITALGYAGEVFLVNLHGHRTHFSVGAAEGADKDDVVYFARCVFESPSFSNL